MMELAEDGRVKLDWIVEIGRQAARADKAANVQTKRKTALINAVIAAKDKILEIQDLIAQGKKRKTACREVGFDCDKFYRYQQVLSDLNSKQP